ncbi:MAG: aldehyde dehydrogenase family protein [Segniliparus sp.]|uniref:aldehyde dehydrogenase family protein n=1 Tax=Segniliparus sp. TaxID=2804064 RepID=UPI003F3E1288
MTATYEDQSLAQEKLAREKAARASDLRQILDAQRAAFLCEGAVTTAVRRDRLKRLGAMLWENAEELAEAIDADFGTRPRELSIAGDIGYVVAEIAELLAHVGKWTKAERPHRFTRLFGLSEEIRHDPLGVVGVAGPWNFPLQLTFAPTAAALAAGNRVMVRPSSVTRRTVDVLAKAAAKYFDPAELAVITADYGPGSVFSKLPFDGFFFTGSPEVGREVARDCADNLVPVTLELGGKNPVVVDRDANIERAARRIAAAKLFNSGQVCLSLDYVFVPREDEPAFVAAVLDEWRSMFPTIEHNRFYTSIINDANYDRIVGHIEDARSKGAKVHQAIPPRENLPDRRSRKIPPTVLTNLHGGMAIEGDEVFGPVLSVHAYEDFEEVIGHINRKDTPLALYWFGPENDRRRQLVDQTRSGSVNGNEFMLNMLPGLGTPFGGVGKSGYGYYHGKHGIETFSHARPNMHYSAPFSLTRSGLSPRGIRRMGNGLTLLLRLTNRG